MPGTAQTAPALGPLAASGLTRDQALQLYRQLCEIRALEEKLNDLLARNQIRGASHLYAGEEAAAVGAVSALRDDDLVTSTHRPHGHFHARQDSLARTPEARQHHLNRMMAELCGRGAGYCRGRGGSMHLADVPRGNLGATGIVGGNLPVAVGAALACKLRGQDRVTLCFFGDGAANTGSFHEAVNMASAWDLPVVFLCENNLYGMSVPFSSVSKLPDVAQRASAYGIPGVIVDGQDPLAVRQAVLAAAQRARQGQGPSLVECKTYRFFGHARSDPRAYRSRDEEAHWKGRDCIEVMRGHMLAEGWASEPELESVKVQAGMAVQRAARFGLGAPEPDESELLHGVYAQRRETAVDLAEERALALRVRTDASCRSIPYWQAVNEALRDEMARDSNVFVFGEDVGVYGGAYGVTRGLLDEFGPKRVIDTPISEGAIAGAALGAALVGMRPVAEIMYADFTTLAMDQLGNQAAKSRYMFGGSVAVPLTMRTQGGAGAGVGAHHSQSLEALWLHLPGIKVVMPSTPYDAKGLLKSAIREDGPVLFIEHKMLYSTTGPVPPDDYAIPLGSAEIKRAGAHVTVVAYSRMALLALEAAESLAAQGIDVEVVDPRTLKPLDLETILASVCKTGRVVCVTEACRTGSFVSELACRIQEQAFDWLDAPVVIVAGADVPIPAAATLEQAAVPRVEDIVAAIKEVMA